MPKQILLVCTGNSCRSVMAQGLLQKRLKDVEQKLTEPVEVLSAGVFAIDGMSASKETIRLLQREGIDVTGHMAHLLSNEQIRAADLILVMESFHQDEILRRVPEAKDKTRLLTQFGRNSQLPEDQAGIPDPIGKPAEVYEVCFATIKDAVERVAHMLTSSGS